VRTGRWAEWCRAPHRVCFIDSSGQAAFWPLSLSLSLSASESLAPAAALATWLCSSAICSPRWRRRRAVPRRWCARYSSHWGPPPPSSGIRARVVRATTANLIWWLSTATAQRRLASDEETTHRTPSSSSSLALSLVRAVAVSPPRSGLLRAGSPPNDKEFRVTSGVNRWQQIRYRPRSSIQIACVKRPIQSRRFIGWLRRSARHTTRQGGRGGYLFVTESVSFACPSLANVDVATESPDRCVLYSFDEVWKYRICRTLSLCSGERIAVVASMTCWSVVSAW